MQCVILAGGLGTRMSSFTENIPKALIPVLGRPFADYQLSWLARCGIKSVLYSVGYKGEMITRHVRDGEAFGLRVEYIDEGQNLRGTGGALRFALDNGKLSDRFLVLYGDSFLPIDFSLAIDKFEKSNLPSMMTIFKNDGNWDNSNVYFDADRMLYDKSPTHELANKMNFIDYGLLAFKKDVIETRVPKGLKVDLAQLLHDLSVEGRLQGYEVFQRFYEIGSPQGHSDFEYWLKSQDLSWIN